MEEADDLFIYRPAHRGRKPGGDLLGGVSALQETDLTGPTSIYKVLPEVGKLRDSSVYKAVMIE